MTGADAAAKVVWTQGMFLLPHHFQQETRYLEALVDGRVRALGVHGWGFGELVLDESLLAQGQLGLVRAAGVLPDGTPFPTVFYLTCPRAASQIGTLEASGLMARMTERLRDDDMLPAIYFIFSRAACDDAAKACVDAGLRLTSPDERIRVRSIAEGHVTALSDADLDVLGRVGALLRY